MKMRIFLLACAAVAALAAPLSAADLPAPSGEVVLTVSGAIAHTNGDGVARFDLAMLDALDNRTTRTETPWYDEAQDFSGPLGAAVLEAVGATGSTMTIRAINDYSAKVPVADFAESPVILATRRGGEVLTVRNKGPLFVIYPFDERPGLYNELYFSRSVWQAVAIELN